MMFVNVPIPRHLCRFTRGLSSVAESAPSRPLPPPRIKRGPTDILRALAGTVGHDPTAAHYKYNDDPYLIPQSNFRKRSHALAHEAGRKAAIWIRDKHGAWFTEREWDPPLKKKTEHFNAEPRIPAYAPKPIYNENSKVTVDDLRYTIDNARVEDAVLVFRLLGGKTAIDEELTQSLLELLAFYNEMEPGPAEWLEERWFASNSTRDRRANSWKLGGLADELFNSLDTKDSRAYCAIIAGMAKHYQAERAYQLSREALEGGYQLTTEVYNNLLSCVGYLREGVEMRVQALLDLLHEMQRQGVPPTAGTLSACLSSIASWGGGRSLRTLALQLLSEWRSLGIPPPLAAYHYLLQLMCKERGPKTDVLSSILSELEARPSIELVDITDTRFFVTAMAVAHEHLQDMDLADRVHALLMKGNNYRLLGDGYRESVYYRHLMSAACRLAPPERAARFVDQLVPHIYTPETTVMSQIIKAFELGDETERLADTWSQLVAYGLAKQVKLLEQLLEALHTRRDHPDDEIRAKIRAAAREMLTFGDRDTEHVDRRDAMRTPQAQLPANALSHIVSICSDEGASGAEWEAATEAARRLAAVGLPADPASLLQLPERAVKRGRLQDAQMALRLAVECGLAGAGEACVTTLAIALNRDRDQVREVLASPAEVLETLQPELYAIAQLHRASEMRYDGGVVERREDTSSDSDSDSDRSE